MKCLRKLQSNKSKSNPNCGGQTNYKKFQYRGRWFDSSWEIEIAKYLDSKKIKWKRDKKTYFKWQDKDGTERRYHPDFYLIDYGIFLEPKNKFLQQKDKLKIDQVRERYDLTIILGDLKEILRYLEKL